MASVLNIMVIKDFLEANNFVIKSNSFTMIPNMNLQILGIVILSIAILVVYGFIFFKRATQFLGHNQSVLQNSWTSTAFLSHWSSKFLVFFTKTTDGDSNVSLARDMFLVSHMSFITRIGFWWTTSTMYAKTCIGSLLTNLLHNTMTTNPSTLSAPSTSYKKDGIMFIQYLPVIPVNDTSVLKLNKTGFYWRNINSTCHNLYLSLVAIFKILCCNHNTKSRYGEV